MNKIKTFFRTLFLSFSEPNYYFDVVKAKFKFSLKYFVMFYVLLGIIFSGISWYFVRYEVVPKIDEIVDEVSGLYPEDLVLNYDGENSLLSTEGVDEPILIPFPESDYFEVEYDNLVAIDTEASAEDISEYSSIVLLTDSHFTSVTDRAGSYQIIPFSDMSDFFVDEEMGHKITGVKVDKSLIDSNLPYIKVLLRRAAKSLPFLAFFGSIIFFVISRLIFLLVMSLFNLLVSMILDLNLKYSKIYQLGLHTITVAEGVTKLSALVFRTNVSSYFSWAFIGVTFFALLGIKKRQKV